MMSLAASEADSRPVTREIGRALMSSSVPIISKLGTGDWDLDVMASLELGDLESEMEDKKYR